MRPRNQKKVARPERAVQVRAAGAALKREGSLPDGQDASRLGERERVEPSPAVQDAPRFTIEK